MHKGNRGRVGPQLSFFKYHSFETISGDVTSLNPLHLVVLHKMVSIKTENRNPKAFLALRLITFTIPQLSWAVIFSLAIHHSE